MAIIEKFELKIAEWHGAVPHLPETARQWIAANSWWMALVAAILTALTVMGIILPFLFISVLMSAFGGVLGAVAGGLIMFIVMLWLLVAVVNIILFSISVKPLKHREKRGWNLLFCAVLITLAAFVLDLVVDFELVGFIFGLLWLVPAIYLLFEIRHYFVVAAPTRSTSSV